MQRARAVDAFVIWTLSVLLAATFVLAGLPKLLGTSPIGFQAAMMDGFPPWIRFLVGLVEVVCGLMLLFPPLATIGAACLAFLTVAAVATQYASGQPGIWVPLLVLLGLAFVAWRRNAVAVEQGYRGFSAAPHPLLKDGIIAGLIGAAVIAVWFFVIDTIAGHPFFTPATLGRALLSFFGEVSPDQGPVTFVIVYTVFHVAAFMVLGLLASLIVQVARQEPSILLGFAMLFAATEIGVYGLVALLGEASPLGRMAWLPIMVGNVLAALAMGWYFWHAHSEIEYELRHTFDEPAVDDEVAAGDAVVVVTVTEPRADEGPERTARP